LTHQGLAHHRCVKGNINPGSIHRARRSIIIIRWNSSYPSHSWIGLAKYLWKGPGYEGATRGLGDALPRWQKVVDLGCW
jgi:hypothetical protein